MTHLPEGTAAPRRRAAAGPIKRLELAWKSLWFHSIFHYLALRPPPPAPEWRSQPLRVLFIRPDGIGDAILSTRLFEAVAGLNPSIRVDVLGSPANVGFLRRLGYLHEVLLFNRRKRGALPRLARELRRRRYDVVVDCRILEPSLTGLLLMLASGAPHRFGIGGRGVDRALTRMVPRASGHITAQLALLGSAFGLDPEEVGQRPKLARTTEEEAWAALEWPRLDREGGGKRLLVNVSAGEPSRAWPDPRFVEVVRQIVEHVPATDIRLIGAPGEIDRTRAIAGSAGVPAIDTPTFGHVIALGEAADVVLTPDTSIVHVAAAFSRPTVALYLKGTAQQWGAFEVPGANLESADRTLDSISADDVLRELIPLLETQP